MKFGWMTLAHSPSPQHDTTRDLRAARAGHACRGARASTASGSPSTTSPARASMRTPFRSPPRSPCARNASASALPSSRWRCGSRCGSQPSCRCSTISRRGRLDIGVGRGSIFNEYEFIGYGLSSDDARERMAEALDVMTRAWTATPLDHKGKYFTAACPSCGQRPCSGRTRRSGTAWRRPPRSACCGEKGVPILTVRLPLAQIGVRLGEYAEGLGASGLDGAAQKRLLQDAAIWRWVYVGESRAAAEDELVAALVSTRRHMQHARHELNPADFRVDPALLNPWTDPSHSEEDGIRFALALRHPDRHRARRCRAGCGAAPGRRRPSSLSNELRLSRPRAHQELDAPLRRDGDPGLRLTGQRLLGLGTSCSTGRAMKSRIAWLGLGFGGELHHAGLASASALPTNNARRRCARCPASGAAGRSFLLEVVLVVGAPSAHPHALARPAARPSASTGAVSGKRRLESRRGVERSARFSCCDRV